MPPMNAGETLATGDRGTPTLRRLHKDAAGQMVLEWSLVLAAVALPMFFVIRLGTNLLAAHYRMVSFLETLPFT